jgi:thiol-disulfide isomerase/thioredoxin/Ca2+-binding EF-hand superfamily protein
MSIRICLFLTLVVLSPSTTLAQVASETAAVRKTSSTPGSDWVFGAPIPGLSRYGWKWFAERYDSNNDQTVEESEFAGERDYFVRLDCDSDGVITAHDFDWSADGRLALQHEATFVLFKSMDVDSNGQITADEWRSAFPGSDSRAINEGELEHFIYGPFRKRRTRIKRKMTRQRLEDEYDFATPAPAPGSMAPDFELKTSDQSTSVRLSTFRGKKPVVLVFGSFTCGNFRTHMPSLEAISNRWGDEAEFLAVYVREAHPADSKTQASSTNARAGILFAQPTSLEQRCEVADHCQSALKLNATMVVDKIDNAVGTAYAATPDRLYVVDRLGRVAFQSGPGPFGFTPREMEQALILTLIADQNDQN